MSNLLEWIKGEEDAHMEKIEMIQKAIELSVNIKKDFFSEAESVVYTDSVIIDILQSEADCMGSILMLSEKEKFEDCFILLRHVFETFLYFWLMLEGNLFRFTRKYNIIPKSESTAKKARDKTFEKWMAEWKSGDSSYNDIINIAKGKRDDIIEVTHEKKGLFSANDPEETGRIIPWYVFAFQEYDPEVRFAATLPIILSGEAPRYRNIIKKRQKDQKTLYHRYIYIESILKNLKLNRLVSDEQADRILVHYNFFSSFLHPNKRIIRTRESRFAFSFPSNQSEVLSELVLLYLCRLEFLYLSKTIKHFRKYYPKGKYAQYEKQAELLDNVSSELWFFDNDPLKHDIEMSNMRKWWLKKSGKTVKDTSTFYYTDPVERLKHVLAQRDY